MKTNLIDYLLFFKPRPGFVVTPIIIDINFGVFFLMVIAGLGFNEFKAADLLAWGGNYRPYTMGGQWWRLLTSIFLHGGIGHVGMNMIFLFFTGLFLEPVIGSGRYLAAYFFTGTAAGVGSMLWYSAVSVGASGAIFGLMGVCISLLISPIINWSATKIVIGIAVIFMVYYYLYGFNSGIDNVAHIVGIISGMFTGYLFYPAVKQRRMVR
ncbi:rhomboid family intramembrane serine protease [Mucilaginibacter terrae]|uniref:rhomboid family intramembrane serine protease n=1 Tax=Mucilaginibacter terrae TaxID=1955052 RepID=UPI003645DD76